jgi:hypothetical protein
MQCNDAELGPGATERVQHCGINPVFELEQPFHFSLDLSQLPATNADVANLSPDAAPTSTPAADESISTTSTAPSCPPPSASPTPSSLLVTRSGIRQGAPPSPDEFVSGRQRRTPLGATLFKQRLLSTFGKRRLVSIPYWEWPSAGVEHRGGVGDGLGAGGEAAEVADANDAYLRVVLGLGITGVEGSRHDDCT